MKINGDLKFRTLGSGELQNAIIERVAGGALGASLPTGAEGRIAFNTDTNTYWFYGGSQWNEFGGGGDISNIINSGGYMNQPNGTFDPTVFSGFINISPTGSPMANLVDALAQLDAAVTVAAGVDTLKELTDVNIDGEGSSPSLSSGQILYYKDGTTKWTQTSVTALSDGDILTWNGGSSVWEPTENSNVLELGDLTDVSDTVTSGASNGQVLRFNSGAAAGNEWTSENLGYIVSNDGNSYITLTGAGAINPRTSGDSIHMYIDNGGATLIGAFTAAELDLTAVGGTVGGAIDINAGSNSAGAGGNVTIDGGAGTTGGGDILLTGGAASASGEAGDIILTGGTFTTNSGEVILYGGGTSGVRASVAVGGAGGTGGNDGGNIEIFGGNGSGTDGHLWIRSGSDGSGGGEIDVATQGDVTITSNLTHILSYSSAAAGIIRFREATANGSDYVGLRAPASVTSSVTYTLPVSPTDTYLLQTNGTGVMSWVDPADIGGDSFATWARSGGTGDASIVADSTTDTVTLTSAGAGSGINLDFNATTDTVAFTMTTAGLTDTNVIVGADKLWFSNSGVTESRTFTNMLADLNVVNNVSGTGLVVQTAADTYAARSVAASVVAGDQGISVVNGNGVSGNPTVGLDIVGLGALSGSPLIEGSDLFAMYDGTNNVKVTLTELKGGLVGDGISLDDLSDVVITSAGSGDILYYNGSSWVDEQPGATSGVQGHDAGLDSLAGLAASNNDFIIATAADTYTTIASGTTGRALLGDETVADAITTLGLDSGGVSDIWVDVAGDTMSGDLNMSGGSPQDARILLTAGTVGAPGLTWFDDLDTGLFHHGANAFCAVTGGVARMTWDPNYSVSKVNLRIQDGLVGAPGLNFESDGDTGLYRVSANIMGVSAGGAERLRIYGAASFGSPEVTTAGAISVESTANYENLIGDPSSAGFITPVDDFLPNAQWVDLYYLRKSGGSMTGDLVMGGNDINMANGSITNLTAPSAALDAVNKNYVDNLVTSGTRWVDPIKNPDLVGIADDEPDDPLSSGLYIAYGGGSYPQTWSYQAGSPVSGSPAFIEVNEYDLMHYTFGHWEKSGTLENGTRLLAGVFTDAIDTRAGQNLDGTGINLDDFVQYVGFDGSPSSNPLDPNNWIFPHGRSGIVTFDVVSVTASTDTFVISGDVTASFHGGNTFTYSTVGSPAGSPSTNDATYTITTVTYTGPNTEVVVVEDVAYDSVGGTALPEIVDGTTTLDSNSLDSHFGNTYLYVDATNEWVQVSGPGTLDAGIGLSYSGNTINVNLGAGIFELPNDEVGIELHNSASGGLILTTDGSTRDNGSSSKLHLLLAAGGGLDQGTAGLTIADNAVTNDMLVDDYLHFVGDAGTPTNANLGDSVTFTGTNGVVVTVTPNGGSPLGSFVDVGIDLVSVPNSALTNSKITIDDDGAGTQDLDLGDTLTVTGGIVSATDALKIRRIEDADGDTYVQVSASASGDEDAIDIVTPVNGGDINLTAGNNTAGDVGGGINLTAGDGEDDGGYIEITAGSGSLGGASGGFVNITGGNADSAGSPLTGDGGSVVLEGGAGPVDTGGANLEVFGGSDTAGGDIRLTTGVGGSYLAGNIVLEPKNGTGSTGGVVQILAPIQGTVAPELQLHQKALLGDGNYIGITIDPALSSTVTYTLPVAPAGNDYVMISQTDGTLSWASPDTVGRTTLDTLDDVVIGVGSPGEGYIGGDILVASGGSPNQYVSQQIQYIYDSTLATPTGSPETTANTSHTINHNLGQKYVNVTVYNTSDQQIIPQSVTLDSANAITVTFNSAIDCVVVIMGVPGVSPAGGA